MTESWRGGQLQEKLVRVAAKSQRAVASLAIVEGKSGNGEVIELMLYTQRSSHNHPIVL